MVSRRRSKPSWPWVHAIIKKVKNRETIDDQRHLIGKKPCWPQLSSPLSTLPMEKTAGWASRLWLQPMEVRLNDWCHAAWGFGPWQEVGKIGSQTSEWWAEATACRGLLWVRRGGPPSLSRHAGRLCVITLLSVFPPLSFLFSLSFSVNPSQFSPYQAFLLIISPHRSLLFSLSLVSPPESLLLSFSSLVSPQYLCLSLCSSAFPPQYFFLSLSSSVSSL